jgi:hypothetical protein
LNNEAEITKKKIQMIKRNLKNVLNEEETRE